MWIWILSGLAVLLLLLGVRDLLQRKHAILRNFPVLGHMRYLLESLGPELRQYIVAGNDEERPFSRDQRRWIYASSKKENNYFGFGSDTEMEKVEHYLIFKHSSFPLPSPFPGDADYDPSFAVPCAKVLGAPRGRTHAFRPASVINISGMSYGSLSGAAVEAMNRGAKTAECLHNTGEGGISDHHRHGGNLIWQIGTGYYGCRAEDGGFSLERFKETVASAPVKAIEIKLSQGAKPGLGGVLPAAKITPEISRIRGIPQGRDCISPSSHRAFRDVDEMLDFVELLASETGLPVGIKSAVGQESFWHDLADHMESGERGVDFISIDGGEGGTGAAPLSFSDHVALPFKLGFSRVYQVFSERELADRVVWNGSGKLGLPENTMLAFALGCDMIAVAREAMLAVGCIQAQECHSGFCPTGVATQKAWLIRGLDPKLKAARMANYVLTLRKEILRLSRACGVDHPGAFDLGLIDVLDGNFGARPAWHVFGYPPPPSAAPQSAEA